LSDEEKKSLFDGILNISNTWIRYVDTARLGKAPDPSPRVYPKTTGRFGASRIIRDVRISSQSVPFQIDYRKCDVRQKSQDCIDFRTPATNDIPPLAPHRPVTFSAAI
jgi:hypothetical protein